jgi:hypothetical protein
VVAVVVIVFQLLCRWKAVEVEFVVFILVVDESCSRVRTLLESSRVVVHSLPIFHWSCYLFSF